MGPEASQQHSYSLGILKGTNTVFPLTTSYQVVLCPRHSEAVCQLLNLFLHLVNSTSSNENCLPKPLTPTELQDLRKIA